MAAKQPESIREVNSRVWDMVLNLVHPAAVYVILQLLMLDRMQRTPALEGHGPLAPVSLLVYGLQFLGAWAVFYTTLLRDMGYRSATGTVLVLGALAAAVLQYVLVPEPAEAGAGAAWAVLGSQGALAAALFPATFFRWRRCRAEFERGRPAASPAATPPPEPPGSLAASIAGLLAGAQTFRADVEGHESATEWFYDWGIWILAIVPLAGAVLIAALKRKKTPELPQVTDTTFEAQVFESGIPVLVHAYRSWSIGDKVMEQQVEKVREAAGGRLQALWLDIERNPGITSLFPTLGEKSVALFQGRRLLWQATGVHDAASILHEIEPHLPKPA